MKKKDLKKLIKLEEPREAEFPESRELFNFVREVIIRVLAIDDRGRLKDCEVGKLAGYGFDETSRWKHGIRKFDSMERLMILHENTEIDEYLLLYVTTGRMSAKEAFQIWELGFSLRGRFEKKELESYLKKRKINFKVVILGSGDKRKNSE